MDASDAVLAGFADYYIPRDRWRTLTETVEETGDWSVIDAMALDPPDGRLMADRERIDRNFAGETAAGILRGLGDDDWAETAAKAMRRGSPLSVACTVELVRRVRAFDHIRPALEMEYRFTSRSTSEGDFIEGIRALIVDKDNAPDWQHARIEDVTGIEISRMLMPLGADALNI